MKKRIEILEILEKGIHKGYTPIIRLNGHKIGVIGDDNFPILFTSKKEAKEFASNYELPNIHASVTTLEASNIRKCPVCNSFHTRTDDYNPETMDACDTCGSEWIRDTKEVTLDAREELTDEEITDRNWNKNTRLITTKFKVGDLCYVDGLIRDKVVIMNVHDFFYIAQRLCNGQSHSYYEHQLSLVDN